MTMNQTVYTFFAGCTICCGLLTAVSARGQDSVKISNLDPVVVTATKYPIKLSETGKVLTVVSREEIERSAGKSLAQVLTEQSGIIVNGANSNPGKDKSLFLRGASNNYTLILLDGIPVNDPSGAGGALDLRMFPVEQIDHIEILKGSQSTLYGSDAIAGVINIITRKGGGKTPGWYGGAKYGSFQSFDGHAGVGGRAGIIDYNLNYTYSTSRGISEALDTTGKANFDRDGFLRNSFQANIGIQATSRLKISPYYRYTYFAGDFDADAFTDGSDRYHALFNSPGAIAVYTLPKGSVTANYGYTYSRRLYESGYGPSLFRGKFHSAELYWSQQLSSMFKLLVGMNYQAYRLVDTTLDKKNPRTTIASPYASLLVQTPGGFHAQFGGRLNHHSEFGDNGTYEASVSYLIAGRVKAFGNWSTGFKAPTVINLFGPTYFGSNPDLKPERSQNAEVGVQVTLAPQHVQATATLYRRRISDLIAFVGNRLINVDQQRDHGLEVEVKYRVADKLTISGSYNFVTGQVTQLRNGKDTSYFNLLRRPKHTVTGSVGYQATGKLFVSVSMQSLGVRSDIYYNPVTFDAEPVTLRAYTLLNAYAEYRLWKERLRVFADARNLGNVKFSEVYGFGTMGFNADAGFRMRL